MNREEAEIIKMYSEEIDTIFYKEIEYIRSYGHWVNAWWTPKNSRNRRRELAQDITSKNKDIEYIKRKKADNQSLHRI